MSNKIYHYATITLGLLAFSVQQGKAQQRKLTLKEAVQLSLQNSKTLQYDSAKIAQSTAALKEAIERRLPNVDVSGSYLALNTPNISLKSSGNSGGETPKVNQVSYGLVMASLPIYAGGKIKYGIEASKYLEKATKLDAEHDKEAIVMNTVNAYAALYKTTQAIEVITKNLEQAKQRVTDFINLENNGIIARNDRLKAELQQSNVELMLLDAKNNYKLASVSLDIMLGLDEKTLLSADSLILGADSVKTIAEYEQLALQGRKDVQSFDARQAAATNGVKSAKADMYPSLALTGGYAALYVPNFITVYNAFNIGVGVKYSLSSLWKTKSKVAQQEALVKQTEANKAMLADNIRLNINQSYENYILAGNKIYVYNKAIEQAAENYRITENKNRNALATTTDLLDAEVAKYQSELNKAYAVTDLVVAYYKLLEATGTLSSSF